MALPNIIEALERTIYETIRVVLVEEGFIPDIYDYGVENPDLEVAAAAQKSYQEAITSIKNSEKGFAIELFNYSTTQQRGRIKPPRIVIESEGFYPGELGFDTTEQYIKQGDGNFTKVRSIDTTSDFFFSIRLISNSTRQYRVLEAIKSKTLPRQGYLKWYNKDFEESGNLFFKYVSFNSQVWENEGIIEKVYRYMIPDAQEVDSSIIGAAPPILSIDFSGVKL